MLWSGRDMPELLASGPVATPWTVGIGCGLSMESWEKWWFDNGKWWSMVAYLWRSYIFWSYIANFQTHPLHWCTCVIDCSCRYNPHHPHQKNDFSRLNPIINRIDHTKILSHYHHNNYSSIQCFLHTYTHIWCIYIYQNPVINIIQHHCFS